MTGSVWSKSFCDNVLCLCSLVQSQHSTCNAEKIRTFTWSNCESTKITETTHYNDDRPEMFGKTTLSMFALAMSFHVSYLCGTSKICVLMKVYTEFNDSK